MGLLDYYVKYSFVKDSEGKECYYPWGLLGRGYVIPDAPVKEGLYKTHKGYIGLMLGLGIGTAIVATVLLGFLSINPEQLRNSFSAICTILLVVIILQVLATIWYATAVNKKLKGLAFAGDYPFKTVAKNVAKDMPMGSLILLILLIIGLLFQMLVKYAIQHNPFEAIDGVLIPLFALGLAKLLYILKLKITKQSAN